MKRTLIILFTFLIPIISYSQSINLNCIKSTWSKMLEKEVQVVEQLNQMIPEFESYVGSSWVLINQTQQLLGKHRELYSLLSIASYANSGTKVHELSFHRINQILYDTDYNSEKDLIELLINGIIEDQRFSYLNKRKLEKLAEISFEIISDIKKIKYCM